MFFFTGYDTKKLSSQGNREEEPEFGLQRAETGDRRLQNNQNSANNGPSSDLRAAHSSDFFSGQRDRGRDEPAPAPSTARPAPPPRQSFRRVTTPRATTTTQYTTQPPPPPPQPTNPPHYDAPSKRKLVRKRPIYVSTAAPTTTIPPSTPAQQQNYFLQQQPQNFNRIQPQRQTTPPPANVPPQYKDEYVEVIRKTPKQNRYFQSQSNPTSAAPFPKSTSVPNFNKKDGLVELYNYETQSTPGLNVQNDNRPFKLRNSFSVSDVPREDFARTNININSNGARNTPTTEEYNTVASRGFQTSTSAYRNFNSVSYEPEKNNFVQFSSAKQNYYTSPTTQPTTTIYTTQRNDPPQNLNTIAYNTNLAFNTVQPANYGDSNEDDGQYRPPQGEDDGQYRPELYERELLSGAHSLNIAASGNRLPEDQKQHGKSEVYGKKPVAYTSAPRPFRPAPTQTAAPSPTTRAPEPTYTTTYRAPTVNSQRTFDYFQTYTTTQRPSEPAPQPQSPEQAPFNFAPANSAPARQTTTQAPRAPEPRPSSRAPPPPTVTPQRPSPRPQHFANPPSNKEDASYDYAYYDSDPGFSEYDHIEEFGKTKTKV